MNVMQWQDVIQILLRFFKKTFKCLTGKAGDYILDKTFVYQRYTLSMTK